MNIWNFAAAIFCLGFGAWGSNNGFRPEVEESQNFGLNENSHINPFDVYSHAVDFSSLQQYSVESVSFSFQLLLQGIFVFKPIGFLRLLLPSLHLAGTHPIVRNTMKYDDAYKILWVKWSKHSDYIFNVARNRLKISVNNLIDANPFANDVEDSKKDWYGVVDNLSKWNLDDMFEGYAIAAKWLVSITQIH
jgi:hypothetical protein